MNKPFSVRHFTPKFVFNLLFSCVVSTGALAQSTSTDMQTARGLVIAKSVAVLSAEMSAKIVEMPFRENAFFSKGDVLVGFDCALSEARLSAANAELRASLATLKSNKELKRFGATGSQNVAIAQANADRLRAELQSAEVIVSKCVIAAPFDGQVVDVLANQFETPTSNTPLLKVVDHTALELSLIVPAAWSIWLEKGLSFQFKSADTRKAYDAQIARIGRFVDPSSQTIKLVAEFNGPTGDLLAGMAGLEGAGMIGEA